MRIGFFTSIEGWGGSEKYLLRIMKNIRQRGHVPVLFGVAGSRLFIEAQRDDIESVAWKAIDRIAHQGEPIINQDKRTPDHSQTGPPSSRGFKLHKIVPGAIRLILGNMREVKALSQVFRRCPVDVMHVNIHGYEMAGVACCLCRIPTYGRHCITPIKESNMARRWLIYWSNKYYTITGGPSKTCVESWRRACHLDAGACRPVLNGIDLDTFAPYGAAARLADSPFNIVAVGRLHPMKGFDVLVKAFASLCDSRMTLTFVGEGPCEEALKQLARQQSCAGTIKFVGYQENVARLYASSHCMVLPSVSHEGCPSVLAEAMACNLPLITSDYGPLPEINLHGQTGLVVAAGDVAALAGAIRYIDDHPDEAYRMGCNGRERAVNCFSLEQMTNSMLAIYEELDARHRLKRKSRCCENSVT